MNAPKKTPTGPPKGGGLYKFFKVTPKAELPPPQSSDSLIGDAPLPTVNESLSDHPIHALSRAESTADSVPSHSASEQSYNAIKIEHTPSTNMDTPPPLVPHVPNTTNTSSTNTVPPVTTVPPPLKPCYKPDSDTEEEDVIIKPNKPSNTTIKNEVVASPVKVKETRSRQSDNTAAESSKPPTKKSKFAETSSSEYSESSSSSASSSDDDSSNDDDDDDSNLIRTKSATKTQPASSTPSKPRSALSSLYMTPSKRAAALAASSSASGPSTGSGTPSVTQTPSKSSIQSSASSSASASLSSLLQTPIPNKNKKDMVALPIVSPSTSRNNSLDSTNTTINTTNNDDDDDNNPVLSPDEVSKFLDPTDYKLPDFVLPHNIRDSKMRRPNDPLYDPRTLYVPDKEYKDMTPAQVQFWQLKSQNMDIVLFFKVGKFYELFDLDAEIGIKELGLVKMGTGTRLHAGFPEAGYAKYAAQLVSKGYKVACAEQTQTPEQLKEYNDSLPKGTKKKTVVDRHICSVLTPATATDPEFLSSDHATYIMSIIEYQIGAPSSATIKQEISSPLMADGDGAITYHQRDYVKDDVVYGITYIDAASGIVTTGTFYDDSAKTNLKTVLTQVRPMEVLIYSGQLSTETEIVLRSELPTNSQYTKFPLQDVPSPHKIIQELQNGKYFTPLSEIQGTRLANKPLPSNLSSEGWPEVLHKYKHLYTQEPQSVLYKAFWVSYGTCLHHLQRLLLDKEIIALANCNEYSPTQQIKCENLMLDSQTLQNLGIVLNQEGGTEGTLLSHLDHCKTSFGRRLLRSWVMKPLFNIDSINERLDCIEELMNNMDVVKDVQKLLNKIPDLQRLLSRVRANGIKKEINAVMYGDIGKVKVDLFLKTLDGFDIAMKSIRAFINNGIHTWKSPLLSQLCLTSLDDHHQQNDNTGSNSGNITNIYGIIGQLLDEFRTAFDHNEAKKQGVIIPKHGVVPEYDDAVHTVETIERELQQFLSQEKNKYGNNTNIKFFHKGKETYQIEFPNDIASRLGSTYEQTSSTTKVKRFYTTHLRSLSQKLQQAQYDKEQLLNDVTRQVFAKFGDDYHIWSRAIDNIGILDCLISLAYVSLYQDNGGCRPQFISHQENNGKALLELRNAIHPSIAKTSLGAYQGAPKEYIPNDTDLGTSVNPSLFILLSGPNMGGKSTLLRQVCCCIIMAQIGCYVPATHARMTPSDRIFTRVGANDRIMQGQSTFLVELEETANILRYATPYSFVILDELGRGTSTFDGTAIAYAVIQYLCNTIHCMTLFSTHYHMLLKEFENDKRISMYHMACKVNVPQQRSENSTNSDITTSISNSNSTNNSKSQDITFLYKFVPGICNKSFGLHVASLAQLPLKVIQRAHDMSELFEAKLQLAHNVNDKVKIISSSASKSVSKSVSSSISTQQPTTGSSQQRALLERALIALYNGDALTLQQLQTQFNALELK